MMDQCETCGIGYHLPSGACDHCNCHRVLYHNQFGLMLAKVRNFGEHGSVNYCVFSGKLHGPVYPTRRQALWHWFTNRFFNR